MSVLRHPVSARAWTAALALALAAGFCSVLSPAAAQGVTVIVDGQPMSFDQPPIIQAGRVFVPLRGIFERLGASVVYANGQINATGRGRTVSLAIGSTQATVDGQPTTLDVAPFVVGARTLVPLRFIAQSLGAAVDWNDSTSTVTIRGGRGGAPPPPRTSPVGLSYQSPTGTVYNHYPQLRFQFDRPVRIGSFQVLLDGRDVTGGVSNNGQWFVVTAPFSLAAGVHRVRVQGRTVGGLPFDDTWSFTQASY